MDEEEAPGEALQEQERGFEHWDAVKGGGSKIRGTKRRGQGRSKVQTPAAEPS